MKQLVQSFKTGELRVVDVPMPIVQPGFVLVDNHFSVISTGTEGGTVRLGKMNLLQKARARPEQVGKVLNVVRNDGVLAAYNAVTRTLEMPIPLGYCCAGTVLEVGAGVTDLEPGQAVACGGAGWANHADTVSVPRNLVVPLPDSVDPRHGAFATLGSIALQSVRQARASLGENVVVVGLGLVGLLVAQILRAAGCRVFGIDTRQDRVGFATQHALCDGATRQDANLLQQVRAWSRDQGADSVIVTATTSDNDPVALAGELCRHKGRVVVVGRTEMTAPRDTYLFKELELTTSLAYGPGTGDPSYEEDGQDYPLAYVRWTENRNMQAFVELIASERIKLEPIISHTFEIDQAVEAFDLINGPKASETRAVLLKYSALDKSASGHRRAELTQELNTPQQAPNLGVSVIGAGSFAANFLVPIVAKRSELTLRGIVSASGVRARSLADQYRFPYCSSDAAEVFADDQTSGVLVLTRHDSHAPLTVAALEARKHVFVEKPLAMNLTELQDVVASQKRSGRMVQVGFNRRFAPLAVRLKRHFAGRRQPMSVTFRSNVGFRPPEHWLHDPVQGGGVILGEAVHFIDFCHWLIGSPPVSVSTAAFAGEPRGALNEDNVHINLRFADGSIATVVYVSNGDPALGRESVEVFAEGAGALLQDFRRLTLSRKGRRRTYRRLQDRGHAAQIVALSESWSTGEEALPLRESALSMLATLQAVESLERREPLEVRPQDLLS